MNSGKYNWCTLVKVGDKKTVTFSNQKELQAIKKSSYSYCKQNFLKRGFRIINDNIVIEIVGILKPTIESLKQETFEFDKVICPNPEIDNKKMYDEFLNNKKDFIDTLSKEDCQSLLKIMLKAVS